MERVKGYMRYFFSFFLYMFARVLSIFVKNKDMYRDLWVVSERGTDARDNGYHFFKYVRENHPQINAVYIIDKNSADYGKVSRLGRVINRGSIEHCISIILAKVLISSHICGYTPMPYFYNKYRKILKLKGKKVFLQYGIIKANLKDLYYPTVDLDLFVCSARMEYEDVKEKYNHRDGVVKLLGLCRYDNLMNATEEKKQILLMPTWRREQIHISDIEEFKTTKYYRAFNDLIHDQNLISGLKKYGYTLIFYPHYEVQRFIGAFEVSDDCVKIAPFKDYDVQTLLMTSAMLVTDYSSVFFDNAYMRKPVLYYQFDKDEFSTNHYEEGYFSCERDGFGKVCNNKDEVSEEILRLLENNMLLDDKYKERIDNFFSMYDGLNCKRNFEAVLELLD